MKVVGEREIFASLVKLKHHSMAETIQKENEDLKNENLTSKETVMIINETNILVEDTTFASNKMVYYPVLFLGIYILSSLIFRLYSYLDKLDRAS